ncbi:MAG: hypothetical protein KJ771_02495 [Nanoarchaeota archaeon]|nr:hypothetical protein [Nanoarchaeota archaeon]
MVKEVLKYVCDVCNLQGIDEAKMKEHEAEPVTGLQLDVGGVYKMIHENSRGLLYRSDGSHLPEGSFRVAIVLKERKLTPDHSRDYLHYEFGITPNEGEAATWMRDTTPGGDFLATPEYIGELTPEEFEVAKVALSKSRDEDRLIFFKNHSNLEFIIGKIK